MPYGDAMTDTRQETCPRCGSKYRDNPACIADHDETFACYECDAPWHTLPPQGAAPKFKDLADRTMSHESQERALRKTEKMLNEMGDPPSAEAFDFARAAAHMLHCIKRGIECRRCEQLTQEVFREGLHEDI